MPTIAELRAANPALKDFDDKAIFDAVRSVTGMDADNTADYLGIPKTRNVAAVANDLAIEFANAVAGGVKAGVDFVSPGSETGKSIGEFIESGERKQSLASQLSKERLSQALSTEDVGEQLSGVGRYVTESPLLAAAQAAGSFVAPGAAIKGARGLATVTGATERAAAQARRFGPITEEATMLAKEGAKARYGQIAGMTTGGVLAGGDAAGSAFDAVFNSPSLADLPEAERYDLAREAARDAAKGAAPLGFIMGAFGAEAALAKKASSSILKTGAKEFGSEAIEEGGTQLSSNIAAGQFAPEVKPLQGVAGAAALGGVLGGGTGLAVGALTKQTPGSLLPNAVNAGPQLTAPANAINSAIDENSPEADSSQLFQQVINPYDVGGFVSQFQEGADTTLDTPQAGLFGVGAQTGQPAVQQAISQASQQVAQPSIQQAEQDAQRTQTLLNTAKEFGAVAVPGRSAAIDIAGKRIYGAQARDIFLDEINKALEGRTDVDRALAAAAVKSGLAKITDTGTAKQLVNKIGKVLDGYQIGSVESVAEAADILNDQIGRLEGASALKKADEINSIYAALTGQPAPEYVKLQAAATAETQPVAKGTQDERLQLQSPTGLRTVSEQGRTAETGGGQPGTVRPDQVRPIGPGSNTALPSAEQNVGQGSVRARTEPSAGRGDNAVPSVGQEQAQEQVTDRDAELRQIRNLVIAAFGARDAAIVLDVLENDISMDAIGKKYNLSRQRVSQIAGDKARESWPARVLLAASKQGLSEDAVFNLFRSTFPEVAADAISELNDQEQVDLSEILGDKEAGVTQGYRIFGQGEGEVGIEDASAENKTAQKYNKQKAKGKFDATAYSDADLQNLVADEIADESELEAIIKEIQKRETVRRAQRGEEVLEEEQAEDLVSQTERLAQTTEAEAEPTITEETAEEEVAPPPKAKKQPKERKKRAVQKPSAKKVSVREGTRGGEKVGERDTEKRQAAVESKAEETGETLAEKAERLWNEQASQFELPAYASLTEKAQKEWQDSVESGNTKLADMNTVFVRNQETKTISNKPVIFKNRRRKLTQAQFDVLDNLKFEQVALDSDKPQTVELAYITLADAMKFPAIIEALRHLGSVGRSLIAVDQIAVFKNEGILEGAGGIQTNYVDKNGVVRTVIGLNEAGFLPRADEEVTHTFVHEVGHAIDQPGYGGVYSSQPEFATGGVVRRELANLWTNDSNFEFLSYPFDGFVQGNMAEEVLQAELFAQAWAAFLNPNFRAELQQKAPQTFKFMEDVANDVKTAAFSTGTREAVKTEVKRKAQLFADYRRQGPQSTQGDKVIKLTPAEKRYVTSDEFAEDVVTFAGDFGLEGVLLASPDFFDIDTKANTLTIPESMVPAMRQFFDWLANSQPGYLGTVPPRFRSGTTFFSRGGGAPTLKSAREQAEKQFQRLPQPLRGPMQQMMDNIGDLAKKGLPFAAFTEDLADLASKYMSSAKDYVALMKGRMAIKTKYERQVDRILQQFDGLLSNVKGTGEGSVNRFLKDSTMKKAWGYVPDWAPGVQVDPDMEARFKAMPAAAQQVIKAVFKHGHDTLQDMKSAVIGNMTSEYDALIAQYEQAGNTKQANRLKSKKSRALADYRRLIDNNAQIPYAPLKRFGNYVVVGRSKAYMDAEAEAERTGDTTALRELEQNENHYFVQFAETMGEAKAIQRMEAGNYDSVEAFEKDAARESLLKGRDIEDVFQRLKTLINQELDSKAGDKAVRGMNKMLADLHLAMLSEASARQSERKRRNIAGAEDDMMRSFATQGRATAHFIASLENSGEIYETLQKMRKQAGRNADARRYFNEFAKRHAMGMDYDPSPLVDKALATTSVWMLLTNPAYYLQNMTQPFMMSLPVVGAKHGYDKSWAAFTKAYREIAEVVRKHGVSEDTYSKLPADVREMIETLVNRGRIDISLEQDLGRWRSTEDSKLAKFGTAVEALRSIAQDIETLNRVATAVAAYRLEAKVNPNNALNYADKVVYTTHGDYSAGNAPRIMRTKLGRVATQFRKFQLIQISLMARLFNDAFAGQDAETRRIGRRALAFTIGHTLVAGGIMGAPGFAAFATLYGMLFGDDDEPFNPELEMRQAIGNDLLADLLIKGVPAAAGVDLSGKLGMGQMLSILPYTDLEFSRRGVTEAGFALLTGPFGGLTMKAADGAGLIGSGQYYQGIEKLLPTGFGNIMKGARLANEGITERDGDVTLSPDEISFLDGFMVALGLPTTKITDRQFVQSAKMEFDKFFAERSSEIKRDYTQAYKKGDGEAMTEAREEWNRLQESRARNGYTRQPLANLLKAPAEQRKRERETIGGVTVNKANRGFVKRITEE